MSTFTNAISFVHHALTFIFGVYVSSSFLGIRMNRKNILILFGFSSAIGIVFASIYVLFGYDVTMQVYPLIIHLPLILFLSFYYKNKIMLSTLSVLTAYMCCQISKWLGIVAQEITKQEWVYYSVRIVATVVVFILLVMFVSGSVSQLMEKPSKQLMIFSVMPFTYYLFDYITGVYTSLLYSGKEVVVEFLGFALCVSFLLFMLIYFKEYENKRKAEQLSQMLKLQQAQSQKEIEAIKRSEHSVSIIRHDMRHFLKNISSFIDNKEYEKAQKYISDIISNTDKTVTQKYSQNKIVNMILSSYDNELKKNKIDFNYTIQIPEKLEISDVDITSILSNALENAIHAVLPLDEKNRHIELDMHINDTKLLISVKNTFAVKPDIKDDMPQSKKEGHGFGTQSIRSVAEKLNGNCQFTTDDECFYLRIIL